MPRLDPSPSTLAAGILAFAGVVIFWSIYVPFFADAIEWAFNIGGRRK